jgi:hypothetical protein
VGGRNLTHRGLLKCLSLIYQIGFGLRLILKAKMSAGTGRIILGKLGMVYSIYLIKSIELIE